MLWAAYEFGHNAKQEYLNYVDDSEVEALRAHEQACRENDIKIGTSAIMESAKMFGPHWHNYDKRMEELKAIFDPNNLSNPPKPIERPLVDEQGRPL
jgi:hypothetical protein